MSERPLVNVIKSLITLPFGAVVVRIPGDKSFIVETTERTRNFKTARSNKKGVEIPTGASASIITSSEEIDIKDWRERPGHTPGASIRVDGVQNSINTQNNKVITPKGVEIIYKRR
jgi:hypothetical protein